MNIENNEIKLLIKQLKEEVEQYYSDTTKSILSHDEKITEINKKIVNDLSNTIRTLIDDMTSSGDIEELIRRVIYENTKNVKDFGAVGDGQHDDYPSIQDCINNSSIVYIPNGTYMITKELVIPDNVMIIGENEKLTIIKGSNIASGLSSIIRLSKSEVGEDTTEATSSVVIKNLTIDANNSEYGIYSNYLTNESRLENLTIINAIKCNLCLLKSWFIVVKDITAKKGKNIGISLGVKQKNEVEVSVNAVKFSNLRAHGNGTDLTHNQTDNIERGCGIIIYGCNNCDFDNVQSELNYGIGVIFKGYNTNHFNSMYIENNSIGQLNRYGLYQTSQTTNGQIIEKLILASGQTILNDSKLHIGTISRIDNLKTFYGTGINYIDYMDYTVLSTQQDFSTIAYEWKEIYSKSDVNIRYGGTLNDVFVNGQDIGYPFLMVLPKESLESSTDLTIMINGASYNLGNSFVKNTPIFKRLSSMKKESHVNEILGSVGVSADLNANISIGYFAYGSKKDTLPIKPF